MILLLLLLLLLVTSGIFRPHTRVCILEVCDTHMSQLSPSVRLPHPESGGGGSKTNQPGKYCLV